MGTDQISSLQALLALLWRSVTRSRRFPEDQESWYAFLIGMRPRMRPPLPQQYFGAAAQSGIVTMKAAVRPRFNVYGTDFGWGRPIAVRSGGGNKPYGKTTLFQGADEGSIDIEACLFAETFEAMMEDAEFMEAVTV
ncbi:hypothetical protein CK203_078406 [Vitis vinifera]|uniref:Acetyltransferase n=1 Tax=Vitis vinifera TaxID=29760 RepID=A0A438F5S7_VITVI|nr:hypothetical protein CK203_078406 [Vitis vinifera]